MSLIKLDLSACYIVLYELTIIVIHQITVHATDRTVFRIYDSRIRQTIPGLNISLQNIQSETTETSL